MISEKIRRNPEVEPRGITIHLFRHGPTQWNTEGRIQGNVHNDILPDRIEEYLTRVGAVALDRPDAFLVSKLTRTAQTARALMKVKGWVDIPFIEDEDWNEKRWGIFEGLTDAEARPRVIHEPELREGFSGITTLEDVARIWEHPDFKVPGGESGGQVKARMLRGLSRITDRFAGENVSLIMVSHAGALISLGLDPHSISSVRLKEENGVITLEPLFGSPGSEK